VSGPQHNKGIELLYKCRESRLHRIHPFNKLAYILLTGAVVYCGPYGLSTAAVVLLYNLGVALHNGVFRSTWKLLWRILLPISMFMVPIHGILYPGNQNPLFAFGWIEVCQEGLIFSLTVLMQLAALLSASLLFVLSTHPVDLIAAIQQSGLPQSLAYLIGSPLLLLPIIRERITTIQDAQRSRGLDSEGNVIKRFFCLFPLIAPLVLSSLIQVEQRAIALELKGFNAPGPKTTLRIISDTAWQQRIRWMMLFFSCVVIVYSLWK